MKIEEIYCTLLRNDGTMLIKMNMDVYSEKYKYCFSIYKGENLLYKSPYSNNSFYLYDGDRLEELGEYRIKGEVKNFDFGKEKTVDIKCIIDKKNAEKLARRVKHVLIPETLKISISNMGSGLYKFDVKESIPKGIVSGWYIYKNNSPIFKGRYSDSSEFFF